MCVIVIIRAFILMNPPFLLRKLASVASFMSASVRHVII